MNSVGIGLVGCGNVGGGVVANLLRNGGLIEGRTGLRLELRRVARLPPLEVPGIPADRVTGDWRAVVHDPSVQVVVELMGGTTVAGEVALAALAAGKPVVTANKALLAERGHEIFGAAAARRLPVYFEAAVAGGIPLIKALREGLRANHIVGLQGIVNGTCNYILTRMAEEGRAFAEVLAEAKALGYAEADDRLDVDGIDAAHKAAILASLAYGGWVDFSSVLVEGIRRIEPLDFRFARKLGYTIKLLAVLRPHADGRVEARVHPALVGLRHMLASVSGVFNAVQVEGDVVGTVLFYGRGAGADPTASAVLADLADAALALTHGGASPEPPAETRQVKLVPADDCRSPYYVRLTVDNRPGVLAQVSAIFGRHGIGISSVFQPEDHVDERVPLVMLVEEAREADFRRALAEIEALAVVHGPNQVIRVELNG